MAPSAVTPQREASPAKLPSSDTRTHNLEPEPVLSADDLKAVANFPVYDADNKEHSFSSLYSRAGRSLVIFVRHAFCGMCQEFLRNLASSVTPEDLAALKTPTTISIIYCGEIQLINDYATYTNCSFPIYADPGERKLYEALNMPCTWDSGSNKPSYQHASFAGVVVKSLWQSVSSGTNMLKGGSFTQIGGEFLFEDGKNTWLHRMQNTRDHTEISQLKTLLGLTDS